MKKLSCITWAQNDVQIKDEKDHSVHVFRCNMYYTKPDMDTT